MTTRIDQLTLAWLEAPTEKAATEAICRIGMHLRERYVPPMTVGEPQPEEWIPCDDDLPPEPEPDDFEHWKQEGADCPEEWVLEEEDDKIT